MLLPNPYPSVLEWCEWQRAYWVRVENHRDCQVPKHGRVECWTSGFWTGDFHLQRGGRCPSSWSPPHHLCVRLYCLVSRAVSLRVFVCVSPSLWASLWKCPCLLCAIPLNSPLWSLFPFGKWLLAPLKPAESFRIVRGSRWCNPNHYSWCRQRCAGGFAWWNHLYLDRVCAHWGMPFWKYRQYQRHWLWVL